MNNPIQAPIPNADEKEIEKIRKQAEEAIQMSYNGIVLNQPISVLPERIFKETFLPYFIGQKNFNDGKNLLTTWFSIAGNPGNPVNIIDDAGSVLFTVPPLFGTEFINSQPPVRLPYDGIINEFHQRTASSPKMGQAFLKQVLEQSSRLAMTTNNHVDEYKRMWNNIFEYYKVQTPKQEKSANQISDGEFIFD